MAKLFAAFACLLIAGLVVLLQLPKGEDKGEQAPVAHWVFDVIGEGGKTVADKQSRFPIAVSGTPVFLNSPPAVQLNGKDTLTINPKQAGNDANLPREAISVSALARIDRPEKYGACIGLVQDNGDYEKGFLLGYDEDRFCFALAGSEAGKTKLTYLKSKTRYTPGKWYHIVGTYDGTAMRLYVNGVEDAASTEQKGPIAYAPFAPFVVGKYKDDDEDYPMVGAIAEIQLHKRALEGKEIAADFDLAKKWTQLPAIELPPRFIVEPYLQFPTRDAITIMWETSHESTSTVLFGDNAKLPQTVNGAEKATVHEVKLTDLKPNTKYLYKVVSEGGGKKVESELRQFMTAVDEDSAFSFGIIGDTQKNPKMTGQIARLIYNRRPHFVVHCGDVVDNGADKKEWVDELLGPCSPLFGRAALFPCIGNHEKNHANYYKYFSLPAPEYYYRYSYGNADFFVIDTNKSVKPDSEQYKWLDAELAKSKAKWKIVYHHHPVWSSDADDYGDTIRNVYRMGDLNARNLMTLYEKHGVDINLNGHIHAYERSWPVRKGKVNRDKGTIYITSGGGGGKLEDFAPLPNWFKAQTRVDFHYCYVTIHGGRLELKAFDQNDHLFDFVDLSK